MSPPGAQRPRCATRRTEKGATDVPGLDGIISVAPRRPRPIYAFNRRASEGASGRLS